MAVQAGHAVAEWILKNPLSWQNEYLIYLKVRSEEDLHNWSKKLNSLDQPHVVFCEPDFQNAATALATLSSGEFFKDLPLMR